MSAIRGFLPFLLLLSFLISKADAIPWPKGYIVHSESPNGRYGVLVPESASVADETEDFSNYLVDLKSHRVVGEIEKESYFRGQNRRGLGVVWGPDWCVLNYDYRFGFGSIFLLEINGSNLLQTDIGDRIQKSLNAVTAKCSGDPTPECYAQAYFRTSSERKIRVRAVGTNNPKALEDRKTCYSLFQGTFDIRAKKWMVTDARSIDSDTESEAYSVYGDSLYDGATFSGDKEKAEWLDAKMNKVYSFLRTILPPDRFAVIKKEQIAWLKTRDSAGSLAEKSKLLEARVRALQELAW